MGTIGRLEINMKNQDLKKRFNHSFSWNLWGSLIFETFKIGQNVLLLHLMAPALYGMVGSIFAIAYLAVRLADFGTANTLTPYFHHMTKSKQHFKKILFKGFLRPVFWAIALAVAGALWFCSYKMVVGNKLILFVVIPAIIILETLRLFFRQFLHMAFQSKQVIIIELSLFLGYLAAVWIPILGFQVVPSLNLIFLPYVADSVLAVIILGAMSRAFYKKLPSDNRAEHIKLSKKFWNKLNRTRILNYFLRIGKNMFTSNLLTPLFALQFGLKQAGIFYFASVLATSLQSIVKAILSYSGNALFAHVKNHEAGSKQTAFAMVTNKLMLVLLPVSIFLVFNFKKLMLLGMNQSTTNAILTLSALYLAITFTEFFFSLYEQFYILEEAVWTVVVLRALEFLAFYGVISLYSHTSPAMILLGIFVVRIASFSIMALTAYFRWNIKPELKVSGRYIFGSLSISLACLLLLSWR